MKYYIPFLFVKGAVELIVKLFQKRASTEKNERSRKQRVSME